MTEKLTIKRGYSMNEQTFWHLFEVANKYNYPIGWITHELSTKKVEDIVTFEIILERMKQQSHTTELRNHVDKLMNGCTDDQFEYFQTWLIWQGKKLFIEAIENPSTIDEFYSDQRFHGFHPFEDIGLSAYTLQKTSSDQPIDFITEEFNKLIEDSRS
jgi:hypothetical protein